MFYKHHHFTGEFQRFYGHAVGDGDGDGIGEILFVSIFNAQSHLERSVSALSTLCQKVLKKATKQAYGKIEKYLKNQRKPGGKMVEQMLRERECGQEK